jgi:hypothetical protein
MTRSYRDPNLESLASAVQQKQRAKRRPQGAPNNGPLVALIVVGLVAGASALVYLLVKNRGDTGQTTTNVADVPKAVADPAVAQKDLKPIRAVSNPRTTPATEEPSVVVTIVSANVGPVQLFPVKKQKAAPTTSASKLFGQIPEPVDQPKTSDPLLAIRVRIQNKSGAAINYRSWNASTPLLADEAKNVYAFYQFNDYVPKGRVQASTTVAPNETIEDTLMFERPVASIRSLDLRLAGQNVGAPQPILISISPSQIAGL